VTSVELNQDALWSYLPATLLELYATTANTWTVAAGAVEGAPLAGVGLREILVWKCRTLQGISGEMDSHRAFMHGLESSTRESRS
jgi:hypothetical protein